MGKSASGAVWLNGDLFSPYDFWQYFRNTEDADVGKFLKIFTRLPLDEIARLAALGGNEINEAKKVLATEVTAIVHGREAAEQAAATARATFEEGKSDADLPVHYIEVGQWTDGRSVAAILAATGFVRSQTEARKKIEQGATVLINDTRETNAERIVYWNELIPELDAFKVQFGKTKFALVRRLPGS